MAPEKKSDRSNRIPINFLDSDEDGISGNGPDGSTSGNEQATNTMSSDNNATAPDADAPHHDDGPPEASSQADGTSEDVAPASGGPTGGPEVAELVATRAELKRLETEVKELKDSLARRQADFENYRKRMERERAET